MPSPCYFCQRNAHFFDVLVQNVEHGYIYMLNGRQLYLLRVRDKGLSDEQLSAVLNISINDIISYEYEVKPTPQELYLKWEALIK